MKNVFLRYECFIKASLLFVIFLFLLAIFILALAPPVARDALIHHLAIPKLWIKHGGFIDTPWAVYSYYPMNLDLLYLIPLYFNNDIIPNLIHMGFGIGTSLLIYVYLKGRIHPGAGLLGFLIFISTPVISKLSTMAYVDLGLVFFITASVLSFMHGRDGGYRQHRWLILSSIAMGLALGTKYNGLVAWFFLTLAIVFTVSRDTGSSKRAVNYGLVFFIISLAVFSPWLIKNALLTGNPFYPLFAGIFKTGASGSSSAGSAMALVHSHASLFKTREMFFGESLWEILLIPVRMFFQGQDNSPRYFDGVLNPLLIIFVPFAFMKKSRNPEMRFFLFLSIFFVLISLFLDQIRIRYVLPAVPFLVILTVMGFVNILEWLNRQRQSWRRLGISGLIIILLAFLSLNVLYIQKYFLKIDPVRYLLKKETRDDFIARHDASYRAIRYINKNTPKDSRIRMIFLAGRGYYLNRDYQEDRSMGMRMIQEMMDQSGHEESFRRYLASIDCTHLLIRYELFEPYVEGKFDPEKSHQLKMRMKQTLKTLYDDRYYTVFMVVPK